MAPELDLIERLCGDDCSLYEALHGSVNAFKDMAHAGRAVHGLITEGFVELYETENSETRIIPAHRLGWILTQSSSWQRQTPYRVRITDAGAKYHSG